MRTHKGIEGMKKEALEILRQNEARHPILKPMSERRKEQIIERIRKTRERLWEEKLAARP